MKHDVETLRAGVEPNLSYRGVVVPAGFEIDAQTHNQMMSITLTDRLEENTTGFFQIPLVISKKKIVWPFQTNIYILLSKHFT